jgi:hypothetical protein
MTAEDGICKACRQPLVQTDDRTYHPAVTYKRACTAALWIVGHYYSFDVEPHWFIPDELDPPQIS